MVVNFTKIIKSVLIIFCFTVLTSLANSAEVEKERKVFSPTNSKYASWVFLGMVENEIGEVYNYFFQLQRHDKQFHAMVALFDYQTKKMVVEENSSAIIENPTSFKWNIGRAFLRYNKITNSWVFGLKSANKLGFNFKVNMLNKPEDSPITRYFREGVSFVVAQAGQLNGHIMVAANDKDQFVTANNTWFRQIWLKNDPKNMQSLNSLLCRFNDGRGLYSIRILDAANTQDSIAGLYDDEGASMSVSQFVQIEKGEDDYWHIKVSMPKMDLLLADAYQKNEVIAGYIVNNNSHGFCMLSSDRIGIKTAAREVN